MAENSIFWTTGSTGDGAAEYTQAELIQWLRQTMLQDNYASEGVLVGVGGELEVTGTSSPISVAAGAAYVYGFPYWSTSSENIAVPTPSVGTTGHRVVLRVDWSAQTVRLELLSASDGVATPPSVTQSAGTTWEISLATLTITTGGTITVTDARSFCHFATKLDGADLDDDSIALAKMKADSVDTSQLVDDSVDDTKVGNRVPQFYRRQGGNANNWDIPGSTDRTPGAVRMQGGSVQWSGSSASSGEVTVTFPAAFNNAPLVFVTAHSEDTGSSRIAVATNPGASSVTIGWKDVDGTSHTSLTLHWLAIGPE